MVTYRPSDGTWIVAKNASTIHGIKSSLGQEKYSFQRDALQEFLCDYFSSGRCTDSQGSSICPIGASPKGGKVLKVRWALPGGGKRGGLRLCIVVYCEQKKVILAQAFIRKDDPSDAEFEHAIKDL